MDLLRDIGDEKIAIANPLHAPYGIAAMKYLERQPWYDNISDNLVYGESVAQAYQFVATGNAEYGFVALSQLLGARRDTELCGIVDKNELRQEAVILARAADSESAQEFVDFLRSGAAREVIESRGYILPEP